MTVEHQLAPVYLGRHIDSEGIGYVCSAGNTWGNVATTYNDTSLGRARRIVACINACAGISTERLEMLAKVAQYKAQQLEIEMVNQIEQVKIDDLDLPF